MSVKSIRESGRAAIQALAAQMDAVLRETAEKVDAFNANVCPAIPELPQGGGDISYEVSASEPYGPTWKSKLPYGLPTSARKCSVHGACIPHARSLAASKALGAHFPDFCEEFFVGESGGRYGMPAHNFDARLAEGYSRSAAAAAHLVPEPYGATRPAGKSLITAWGASNPNRDYARQMGYVDDDSFPWDMSARDEVEIPVTLWASMWADHIAAGCVAVDAARGVRLHHALPTEYKKWLSRGRSDGWGAAWASVPKDRADIIDKHLKTAWLL